MKLSDHFKYTVAAGSAAAIMILGACRQEDQPISGTEPDNGTQTEPEYGDSYWAARAFIGSDSDVFTSTNLGGTIAFPAGGGEAAVSVDCGTDWTVDVSSAGTFGISTDPETGVVTVSAEPNAGAETLSGAITFVTAADRIRFATVSITQDSAVWLSVGAGIMDFDHDGGKVTLTVESNYDWTWSVSSSTPGGQSPSAGTSADAPDWLTVSVKGSSLTGTASVNDTGEDREALISITAGDGAENVAEFTVKAVQSPYDPAELVLIYEVASADTKILLPLMGTVDCTVDWGDGADPEAVTSATPSHTYAAPGGYRVRISGTVTTLNGMNVDTVGRESLAAVRQWGLTGLVSVRSALRNCINLTYIPGDTEGSFATVTDFFQFLTGCTGLTELPAGLFAHAASATEFQSAFFGCTGLNTIPETLFSACASAERFYMTFYDCTGLTSVPENLFASCPNVTTFAASFRGCTGLTSVPEGLFSHNPEVSSFANAFYLCTGLTSVPEGLFASCPRVTDFSWVFSQCTSLGDIPAGIFSRCPDVTDFSYAFYGCSLLNCESPYDTVDSGGETVRVHLYERTADLGYAVPDSFGSCFRDCTLLSDYASIPSAWGGGGE